VAEQLGKVTAKKPRTQNFVQTFNILLLLRRPSLGAARACFPKASAKLRPYSEPAKFFGKKICHKTHF
jgi:hypothetical protein